jgi:N-acetylglucosamine-6-phosphate deacetylase
VTRADESVKIMSEHEGADDSLLLRGAAIVGAREVVSGGCLLVARGRIERVFGPGESVPAHGGQTIDLEGLTLCPGFIDIHVHGALGVDVNEADADGLRRVSRFLAARGVTSWLPTLVPAPDADYARAARAVEQLMSGQEHETEAEAHAAEKGGARALGLHYEGPFVNHHQCGALRTQFFRTYAGPADLEALALVRPAGAVHMTTLAPEVEGGVELVRDLAARGWVVSIGHTRADLEVLERARAAGARHMTHFMNAMSPLHHRAPGPVGWGLLADDVTCDLIADGVHSDPLALRLVVRAKTPERVALISDAVAPAGLGDGVYRVWGETIRVEGGRTSNERGSIAGSVTNMLDAVRLCLSLGMALPDVAHMAASVPARVLGIDADCGSVEAGKRADLVALDAEFNVRLTLVGGRMAFRAD